MTYYSDPVKDSEAQSIVTQIQARLAEVGLKSEITTNWYHYQLTVKEPQDYVAFQVLEGGLESLEGGLDRKLIVVFSTIRLSNDGETLYHGVNLREDLENFHEKIFDEAKRQNDWVKQKIQREVESAEAIQSCNRILQQLKNDFPTYAKSILIGLSSPEGPKFSLGLHGLTEDRIRQILNLIGSPSMYAIIGIYSDKPTIWGIGGTPDEALADAQSNGFQISNWSIIPITDDQVRMITKKGAEGTDPRAIGIELAEKDWLNLGYRRA